MEELKRITERTAERHRILTLCSSAANQQRTYDKSLIHKLQSCTAWINEHKDDVLDAYVLAARNTQLGSVTNAHVGRFFLPVISMPVEYRCEAEDVVILYTQFPLKLMHVRVANMERCSVSSVYGTK